MGINAKLLKLKRFYISKLIQRDSFVYLQVSKNKYSMKYYLKRKS